MNFWKDLVKPFSADQYHRRHQSMLTPSEEYWTTTTTREDDGKRLMEIIKTYLNYQSLLELQPIVSTFDLIQLEIISHDLIEAVVGHLECMIQSIVGSESFSGKCLSFIVLEDDYDDEYFHILFPSQPNSHLSYQLLSKCDCNLPYCDNCLVGYLVPSSSFTFQHQHGDGEIIIPVSYNKRFNLLKID